MVGAPAVVAGAGLDSVAVDGEIVNERGVVQEFGFAGGDGDDFMALRETAKGLVVGEGTVEFLGEDVFAVGRGIEVSEEAGFAELASRAGEADRGDLGGGIVGEDVFVVGGFQEVFVGGRGGGLAIVFLDDWAGGDLRAGGRGTAGGDGEHGERGVVEPGDGVGEDGVEAETGDAGGGGLGDIDDPEAEAGGFGVGVDEGDVAGVGGPLRVKDVQLGGQACDGGFNGLGGGSGSGEQLQLEGDKRTGAAGCAEAGIETQAGEAVFGFGEVGDGGQRGALLNEDAARTRRVGGREADGGGGRRVNELDHDLGRELVFEVCGGGVLRGKAGKEGDEGGGSKSETRVRCRHGGHLGLGWRQGKTSWCEYS